MRKFYIIFEKDADQGPRGPCQGPRTYGWHGIEAKAQMSRLRIRQAKNLSLSKKKSTKNLPLVFRWIYSSPFVIQVIFKTSENSGFWLAVFVYRVPSWPAVGTDKVRDPWNFFHRGGGGRGHLSTFLGEVPTSGECIAPSPNLDPVSTPGKLTMRNPSVKGYSS